MKSNYVSVLLTLVVAFCFANQTHAQESIKTITAFKQRSAFNFTSEWQYLSTDLYLLNGSRFNQLLNDVAKINIGKKPKKLSEDVLQSFFIQAKIKNIKYFGGDVVYPIYNFNVREEKNNIIVETENIEVVKLIDNLPLNESNDVIDAEILGEAITKKNSNDFLLLIGSQLQNFSKAAKPTTAIFDLIGEFGKFIETKSTGKQYKFSSTIRLYESQDFNKKVHSINIYVLAPSSTGKIDMLAQDLENALNTDHNLQVNQTALERLVKYQRYPMIVIVNFKSRYNSQPVVGDQISPAYISDRALKIHNLYQNGGINEATYMHEQKLIEFLKGFTTLKINIDNYKLNVKNNIAEDFSRNLFVLLNNYNNLLNIRNIRARESANNAEFKDEFLPKYESVINTAGLYLKENLSLAVLKEAADLLDANTNPSLYADKADLVENNLRVLYTVKIPDEEKRSQLATDINRLTNSIEQAYFARIYTPVLAKMNSLAADDKGLADKEKLEAQYVNTNCQSCKSEFLKAANNFNTKYQNAQTGVLIKKNEEINQQAFSLLFSALEKRKCIDKFISEADSNSNYKELLKTEVDKIDALINELRENRKVDVKDMTAQSIRDQNSLMEAYIKRLESSLNSFCANIKGICDCTN
jgi:uncharacterized protein YnzC (UPF0291/DUF896 family)